MDEVLYPQQAENFKTLKREQGKSQRWLAKNLEVTDATVTAWCQGKKQVSRNNAMRIVDLFPEYTVEFIRGESPYKNKRHEIAYIIAKGREEGTRLRAATLILADLSGFTIANTPIERTGDEVVDTVHEYTSGFDLSRNGKVLHLTMDEMSAVENYICDFVELTLDRLLKAEGKDREGR